ncbi:hypothetical protein GCM10027091_17580 [Streptomyces daliensis]
MYPSGTGAPGPGPPFHIPMAWDSIVVPPPARVVAGVRQNAPFRPLRNPLRRPSRPGAGASGPAT